MSGFLFTLLAVLLVGLGARDQLLLAVMTARQGARPALLLVALVSGAATTGIAAAASGLLAGQMGAGARLIFAAIALGLAGAELLIARKAPAPSEPTQSLGAFALVLFAQQLTDAVRFLVLAIAVAVRAPVPVGIGGVAGAAGLALMAWIGGEALASRNLTGLRRALGVAALLLAAAMALRGMGRI